MTSGQHSRLPQPYTAAEVADALGCSEWWVKEQARRRRIPFTRSGGGYRFTKGQVEEIFRILEERPEQPGQAQTSIVPMRRRSESASSPPVAPLRARRPRRARNAA
ncbi:helix-turn-helix domain-containing protein [Streptomyces sp. NBC_00885]|uniref:helix-turn-helix domain-containing protein n=1 Tax=Streptomyces sp. NBC_00885 TaxID=2975857 RepID=UPI00386EA751|nr:helix-turn-helix domain-containing protein [Streptomyces sp. NBC_00885]